MHVFLTGASGYIGSAVADRLRDAGHVVSGLARSDAAATRLSAAGIQPVRGNFTDLESIGAAARFADGVISMATTYDPNVDGPAIGAMLAAPCRQQQADDLHQWHLVSRRYRGQSGGRDLATATGDTGAVETSRRGARVGCRTLGNRHGRHPSCHRLRPRRMHTC